MLDDFVILEIGKIIIKRENNRVKYYKQVDDKLYELSSEELECVNNIFNHPLDDKYHSEKLVMIAEQNLSFSGNYGYIMNFLNHIESIIPEHCRENFYRNLRTLKLNLDFDSIPNKEEDSGKAYTQYGGYSDSRNEITLTPASLQSILEISKKAKDPNNFFWREVNSTLLHELLHMASTNYDNSTGVIMCGFDINPPQEDSHSNRGLTEGMTELITMDSIPGTAGIAFKYYIECLFVNQLIQIVGKDAIIESYFGNYGTSRIEDKLNSLIDSSELAKSLFQEIELNFRLRDIDCQQSLLGNIQLKLIKYFSKKIENDLKSEAFTRKQIEQSVNFYDSILVTTEKLEAMKKNPNNYIGLNESMQEFENLRARIIEHYASISR